MTEIQNRYHVRWLGIDKFGIRDLALKALCGLEGRPLMWKDGDAADAWLRHCYRLWGAVPNIDEEPPPASEWGRIKRRKAYDPNRSPWELFLTPPSDSRFG